MDGPKPQERVAGSSNSSIDFKLQDKKLSNKKSKFDFISCGDNVDLSRRKSVLNDRTSEKSSDSANVSSSCNGHFSGFDQSAYTSDKSKVNGLDSKSTKIRQIVEDAISPESKQAVAHILEQVQCLNTVEKLLLYLQLPTGKAEDADPLRQPLNPLGSRFEIQQTITWIETHLEEDQEISLPKQNVYDEYIAYCNVNRMKPLSTADFGKVMKQVFPRVRPRRLGTRGNSRYCYSGLRKKMKLNVPLLPELGGEPTPTGKNGSDDELSKCVSYLILEWAEKLLDVKFDRLQDLACHLVQKMCFDTFSAPVLMLASITGLAKPKSKGASAAEVSKHRETQLQLQRKLQERFIIREQKRKLQQNQQQAAGTAKVSSLEKAKSKRAKMSECANSGRDKRVPGVSSISVVPKVEPELSSSGSIICDSKDRPTVPIAPIEYKVKQETTATHSSESNCELVCDTNNKDSSATAQTGHQHQNLYKASLCDSQSMDNQLSKRSENVNKLSSGASKGFLGALDNTTHLADSTSTSTVLVKRRKSSDGSASNTGTGSCVKSCLNVCTNSLDSSSRDQSRGSACEVDASKGRSSATFPPVQEVNAHTVSLSKSGEKYVQLHSKSPLPNTSIVADAIRPAAVANKLPIPRLSNSGKNKQLANVIIFPPATTATILQQSQPPQKCSQKKYKPIQPKPQEEVKTEEALETSCDIVPGKKPEELAASVANCDKGISVDRTESTNLYLTEISQESFIDVTAKTACVLEAVKNGTNDESIRCLENDVLLTDYFHGGNNSQEQEEELIKYFQHHNSSSSNEEVEEVLRQNLKTPEELPSPASKCDQLSQLRLLLERNLKPTRSHATSDYKCEERDRSKANFCTPSPAVSVTPSVDQTGSVEGTGMLGSNAPRELVMTASKSLSLLSRRSQQHDRAVGKPNLMLSPLVSTNHSSNLATRRRVSFETSVMEHAVPHSPNTRSFTPISPGPYSPVGIHRNSKSSSANASPFVSPRNTPVLRSRHNCSQASGSQSCSYVVASNGPRCRQHAPAKIVRSNSVNSHVSTVYRPARPQTVCCANLPQSNTFAIPDSFPLESSGMKHNLTASVKSLPPMSPLSISAPQSPMLHYQHLNSANCKSESDVLLSYGESLLKEAMKNCRVAQSDGAANRDGVAGNVAEAPVYTSDPLAQEVSQIFQDASSDQKNVEALLAALPGASQMSYRSQSVPLHRMMSGSSLVSPQSTQPSPLYPGHQQAFTFSNLSSAASSVAPTPVPSEFMDFSGLGETEVENEEAEGINTENLAQILNILNNSAVQKVVDHASLAMAAEGDVDCESLTFHSQQRNSYSSRSYPNTPVPYKNSFNRDPLVSSFNMGLDDNFGVMSRSYPSTPLLGCSFVNGDEPEPFQNATDNVALSLLNAQQEPDGLTASPARRNINLMSSFCVDELQLETLDDFQSCDPLSELVQEVQDVGEQGETD